jgi:uncharacterized protein
VPFELPAVCGLNSIIDSQTLQGTLADQCRLLVEAESTRAAAMSTWFPTELLYPASGFAVGLLVGMTGVGGGSLMTPLLILLFGVHPASAVGTDLLYAAATKTGGSLIHGFSRTVEWKVVARLATGSVPASAVSLLVLSRFDLSGGAARAVITTVLGVGLYLTALVLIFRRRILAAYAVRFGDLTPRRTGMLTVMVGAVLGILVSISSVGAGAMGVTALILLYPRLPAARIVGTDIAHAVPLTLVGGLGYWILGSVDWHLLGALLVGSIPGIVAGSYLATRVPEGVLRVVLSVTLIVVATRLLM